MGGRGSASRMSTGRSRGSDWREAFDPGQDYEMSGDVDHSARRVTSYVQRRWDEFSHGDVADADRRTMTKDWELDSRTGASKVYGYIKTTNAMAINKLLYDPANEGKTDEEIFTRRDNAGRLRDLQTVRTLDRAISSHKTRVNGTYSRYTDAEAIAKTFGFTPAEMSTIAKAGTMTGSQLKDLNGAFQGKVGYSRAYTSASANRSLNAFKGKYAFERRLYVPEGTNAYIPSHNAQESETIFGRHLRTRFSHVTVEDGHIVIHEMFDGYRKK